MDTDSQCQYAILFWHWNPDELPDEEWAMRYKELEYIRNGKTLKNGVGKINRPQWGGY